MCHNRRTANTFWQMLNNSYAMWAALSHALVSHNELTQLWCKRKWTIQHLACREHWNPFAFFMKWYKKKSSCSVSRSKKGCILCEDVLFPHFITFGISHWALIMYKRDSFTISSYYSPICLRTASVNIWAQVHSMYVHSVLRLFQNT